MTFQREYEVQERSKRLSKQAKDEKNNEPITKQIPQTSSEMNAQQISQTQRIYDVFIIYKKQGECYPYGYIRYRLELLSIRIY